MLKKLILKKIKLNEYTFLALDYIMTRYKISLLVGDGIGPELSECVNKILENIHDKSSSLKFEIVKVEAGDNALQKYNSAYLKIHLQK